MKKNYLLLFISCLFAERAAAQCTSQPPYYEGFQSLTFNNQLPPCWLVSNAATCLTSTVNPNYVAQFYYTPANVSYFFTNGIQLTAGVTYSMATWYRVNANNAATWTDYTMLMGSNQNPVGQFTVASSNGAVSNTQFALLSNTFVVPGTGVYYASIRGTSSGVSGATHLEWDDLMITVPCIPVNTPGTVISGTSTICDGNPLVLNASGADTYTWSNGVTGPTYSVAASVGMNQVTVMGTNSLTGCTATAVLQLTVYPSPGVSVFTSSGGNTICSGTSPSLTASGMGVSTFSWSTAQQGTVIVVSPGTTTGYTVTGANASGCSASASLTLSVLPTPTISVDSPTLVCTGDMVTYSVNATTGSGNYNIVWQWSQGGGAVLNPVTIPLFATSICSVTVMDIAYPNCSAKSQVTVEVDVCTGLKPIAAADKSARIYPNPSAGIFHLEGAKPGPRTIEVTDLAGRVVLLRSLAEQKAVELDLRGLPQGIYGLKLVSGTQTEHLKIIKE